VSSTTSLAETMHTHRVAVLAPGRAASARIGRKWSSRKSIAETTMSACAMSAWHRSSACVSLAAHSLAACSAQREAGVVRARSRSAGARSVDAGEVGVHRDDDHADRIGGAVAAARRRHRRQRPKCALAS
jgi:hypothetical protein